MKFRPQKHNDEPINHTFCFTFQCLAYLNSVVLVTFNSNNSLFFPFRFVTRMSVKTPGIMPWRSHATRKLNAAGNLNKIEDRSSFSAKMEENAIKSVWLVTCATHERRRNWMSRPPRPHSQNQSEKPRLKESGT